MMFAMKRAIAPSFLLAASVSLSLAQDAPIDWKTLATEFSQNEAAAEAKYQGKLLTVSGPVSAIAGGDMTVESAAVAVTLATTDGPGPDVKCLFENSDLEPKTQLYVPEDGSEVQVRTVDGVGNETSSKPMAETGQQLTVTGSFVNFEAGDVVLRHCRLGGSAGQ